MDRWTSLALLSLLVLLASHAGLCSHGIQQAGNGYQHSDLLDSHPVKPWEADYENDVEEYLQQLFREIRHADWIVEESTDQRLLWQSHKSRDSLGGSVQWNDCGGTEDIGHVTSLTLSPVPLKIPGDVLLGFTVQLKSNASAPITIDVEVKKKISFFYIKVKTLRLPDLCATLAKTECPSEFTNCHCPFEKGTYTFPPTQLTVGQMNIPGGSYHITIWFSQGGQQLGCLYLEVSVA